MTYTIRPMELPDIPQVMIVDELSFATPWSARTYQFEINHRDTSHLLVVEETPNASKQGGIGKLLQRLRGGEENGAVLGYGGFWLIAGEAHISTIAVHPNARGRSLGELLLVGMLQRAINLEAEYCVLEVRESNANAKALYEKYEYNVVGKRKHYYRDNNEDALLMEIRPLDDDYQQRMQTRVAALRQRVAFDDQFSEV